MTFEIWLTLFLASVAISVSPGAGAVLSMNYGINYGLKKSYWAILGLQVGYLIQMIIVIIGLKEILKHIKENVGFDKLYSQTALRAKATREALIAIGFELYPSTPADAMTTVYTENAPAIRKILKTKYNVNIAGGQDHIKSLIFRINHMGLVEDYEAAWAVNAVELALDDLGLRTFDGTANKVFSSSMFKGN